jgi:acetyltransferase EpsM
MPTTTGPLTIPDFPLPEFPTDSTAIIIYGGGGHGKALIDLVRSLGSYRLMGIVDDTLPRGTVILGIPVLGGSETLPEFFNRGVRQAINAVGGIGNVTVRVKVFEQLARAGFTCPTVIHPRAFVESSSILESGVQVLAQSYISSDVHIGFGTLINAGVIVSHDCVLGKCVNLSPGAMLAGNVRIDDYAQIGMGVTINLSINIGSGARVGNGATVKADVPPGGVVRAGSIWPAPG